MATQTTNLNLTKPNINELYNVGVFNENFDKIDGAIGQKLSSLPSAIYNAGSPSTMVGTASVFQGVSAFSGYGAEHMFTEPGYFSADPNGFKVLKSGTYLLLLNAHYNTSANNVQMATQFFNYTKQSRTGSIVYNCSPVTWGALSNHVITHLDANDIIITQFQKYSTATADWRPSSVRFSIFLLKDDAMENGAYIPGDLEDVVTEKLLWTNPNPTASFGAQTVALDLSGYESIRVEFTNYTSGIIVEIDSGTRRCCGIWNTENTSKTAFVVRGVGATPTGVYFDNATYKWGDSATTSLTENNYVKPTKIYGIKKVTALDKGTILEPPKEVLVTLSCLKGQVSFIKWGNVVQVAYTSDTTASVPNGDLGQIGTIPEGMFPARGTYFSTNSSTPCKIEFRLGTDGRITGYNYTGSAITAVTTCRFNATYICK